jgi:hypothetical protein
VTDKPVVVVSGFGRSGTTMMMQMLEAGGIPTAPGAADISHEHNGPGNGPALMSYAVDAAEPGTAIKILDPMNPEFDDLPALPPMVTIWMDRALVHQAVSYRKFVKTIGLPVDDAHMRRIVRSWQADVFKAIRKLERFGPVLRVSYDATLVDPNATAWNVATFLCPWFLRITNPQVLRAMAEAVHFRGPEPMPDLTFEHTGRKPMGVHIGDTRDGSSVHLLPEGQDGLHGRLR